MHKEDIVMVIGIIIIVVLLILYVIATYNGLTKARNKVKTNWAQIDVVLKRFISTPYGTIPLIFSNITLLDTFNNLKLK